MDDSTDKRRNKKGDFRGMNPNSAKNLIPRINPKGRPPKPVCLTSWLKEYAELGISEKVDPKTLTYAQTSALMAWRKAAQGDIGAYSFITDRIDGKAMQAVELTGKDGAPLIPEINILLTKIIQVFLQIPGISDEQKQLFADGINQQLKDVVPNLIEDKSE
jgi:hypothetical protein